LLKTSFSSRHHPTASEKHHELFLGANVPKRADPLEWLSMVDNLIIILVCGIERETDTLNRRTVAISQLKSQ
jgi:hypothetical protein